MNPTYQQRRRVYEDDPDPETLARLDRRIADLERRLGSLDLRLADALAAERKAARADLDELRAELTNAGTTKRAKPA